MKKITVNGYNVWVDEQAEIEKNDCCYNYLNKEVIYSVYNKIPIEFGKTHKIICADKELNLEGVPTREEWLAKENSNKYRRNDDLDNLIIGVSENSFLNGYQSAKQDLPTWQDVEKAIELSRDEFAGEFETWKFNNGYVIRDSDGYYINKFNQLETPKQLLEKYKEYLHSKK